MSKHTPGPWTLTQTKHETIVDSWHIHIGEHQIPVFPYKRIYSDDRTQSGLVIDDEHMANARLIAAAPDLLEFAKEWLDRQGTDENYMVMKARAAIAKATGEQA
jgi:hypothetical protein